MSRILRWVFVVTVVVAVAMGIARSRSGLNGTWIKRSGDRTIPNEVSIRVADNEFRERWFGKGGLLTIVVQCDGAERPWSSSIGIVTTYHAKCDRKMLVITEHARSMSGEVSFVEQWVASQDGHQVVVTGDREAVFDRRPLLASLFSATP